MFYKLFTRRFLFFLNPEFSHNLVLYLVKLVFLFPGFKFFCRNFYCVNNKKLSQEVFGLHFKNPIGLAAGFDKNAEVFNEFNSFGFGFVEIGTVTPIAQSGNDKPRLFRVTKDKALINRMGFNNDGVEKIVKRLKNKSTNIIVGGNIGKNKITPNDIASEDYIKCFKKIASHVDYLVLNISSPNTPGLVQLQNKSYLYHLLSVIQELNFKTYKKPILIKISPDLSFIQIDEILDLINEFKISGIIATNTSSFRHSLNTSKKIINKIGHGGLSGRPIYKKSREIVAYISKKTNRSLPIIAVGGIMSPDDAVDMIRAGASLIQIYTGFIYAGPSIVRKINKKILKEKLVF